MRCFPILRRMKREVKLLLVFLLLVPLGLLGGGAWGEWAEGELREMLGFVPYGVKKLSGLWKAPVSDYSLKFLGELPSYLLSAIVGAGLIILIFVLIERLRK